MLLRKACWRSNIIILGLVSLVPLGLAMVSVHLILIFQPTVISIYRTSLEFASCL